MGTYKIKKINIPAAGRNIDYKYKGGLISSSSFGASGLGGSWLDQYFTFNTDTDDLSISKPLKDYYNKDDINTLAASKANKNGDLYEDFNVQNLNIHGEVNRLYSETIVVQDARLRLNRKQGDFQVKSGFDIYNGADIVSTLEFQTDNKWKIDGNNIATEAWVNNNATVFNAERLSGYQHTDFAKSFMFLNAGNGLIGGGNLTSDRTISLGTPSTINSTSTNLSSNLGTHTHALDLSNATANNADNLGGFSAASYPRKAEDAVITGEWTFNRNEPNIYIKDAQGGFLSSLSFHSNRVLFRSYNYITGSWERNVFGVDMSAPSNSLRVNALGFTGLGIMEATERLHVAGNGLFEGNVRIEKSEAWIGTKIKCTLTTGGRGVMNDILDGLNNGWRNIFGGHYGGAYLGWQPIINNVASASILTLFNSNKVGINTTTTPTEAFGVNGGIVASGNLTIAGTSTLTGAVTAGGSVIAQRFVGLNDTNNDPVSVGQAKFDGYGVLTNRNTAYFSNTGNNISFCTNASIHSAGNLPLKLTGSDAQFGGNLQSLSTFSDGFGGSGWKLDSGSENHLTVDRLTVRGRMDVYELLVNSIKATNGSLWVTDSAKVVSVTEDATYYYLNFDDDSGRNPQPFAEGDIIKSQKFTGRNVRSTTGRLSSLPSYISSNQVALIKSTVTGNAPVAGDDFVRIGNNTNTARQGSIYLTASDSGAPYLDVLDGVNSNDFTNKTKVRLGNLAGINNASGYGFYGDNVFLTGKLLIGDLTKTNSYLEYLNGLLTLKGRAEIDEGKIADFNISTTNLYSDFINIDKNKLTFYSTTTANGKIDFFRNGTMSADITPITGGGLLLRRRNGGAYGAYVEISGDGIHLWGSPVYMYSRNSGAAASNVYTDDFAQRDFLRGNDICAINPNLNLGVSAGQFFPQGRKLTLINTHTSNIAIAGLGRSNYTLAAKCYVDLIYYDNVWYAHTY